MFETESLASKSERALVVDHQSAPPAVVYQPNQHKLMVIALLLLLAVLGLAIYTNRDFWFPDTQDAEDQPAEASPSEAVATPAKRPTITAKAAAPAKGKNRRTEKKNPPPVATEAPAAITTRTVLPPLEVEVIAGDRHQTIRPGSTSVRVDLQPGAPTQMATEPTLSPSPGTAAAVTSDAAERVQMSADTADVVSRPVKPGYPLLARQMKVQGSVILQALIGRDGVIQDLHVLSGPPILAAAAEDAVRQWHFKPHLQGTEPVETQAKITVNFTISTN